MSRTVPLTCDGCGKTLRVSPRVRTFVCSCKSHTQAHDTRKLWIDLHCYAPEHADNWSPKVATRWLAEWFDRLPEWGCGCKSEFRKISKRLPSDVSSAHKFFARAHEWHSAVNDKLGTPRFSLDEAFSTFWPQHYQPHSMDDVCIAVTALSLLPKHLERQGLCLDSWKRFGLTIVACNTAAEIKQLKPLYPQVSEWIKCEDVATHYSYPTQRILNLARVAVRLRNRVMVINSDIEIHGVQDAIRHALQRDAVLMGVRWNYVEGEQRWKSREFQWGIDAFSFTPEQSLMLPADFPFAIGHSMWDYAVPAWMQKVGVPIEWFHNRLFYHEDHKQHWHQDSWNFGAQWLMDHCDVKHNTFDESAAFREGLDDGRYYHHRVGRYVDKRHSAT